MPPKEADLKPPAGARCWPFRGFRSSADHEIQHNAGDPGVVLARRLSNAEYDYTIRDLTGVDMQPTREFPVDPSNTAGFDNSGESLVMSPALLNKYLKAAREVANHMFLKPHGFAFAPYPMLAETDRDKFCVQQIIDFYHQQDTDYADYFEAAWRFKNRAALGKPNATLADLADAEEGQREISGDDLDRAGEYEGGGRAVGEAAGDCGGHCRRGMGISRRMCARVASRCADMWCRLRKKVEPRFLNITAGKIGAASAAAADLEERAVCHASDDLRSRRSCRWRAKRSRAQPNVEPETANQFGPGATRLVN